MGEPQTIVPFRAPAKPLGRKAYGSIPHLPGSRLGPGDWRLNDGQARILLEQPRPGDRIIATAKLDGACVGVARCGEELIPLIRAGYRASDGDHEQLRLFDVWARREATRFDFLRPGERIMGEWLAQACGTLYDAAAPGFAPFVAFDLFRFEAGPKGRLDDRRVLRDEFAERCARAGMPTAALLADGPDPAPVAGMMRLLGLGRHGEVDIPEGVVWRVEREDRVDFLAKFVRADKVDGSYLPEVSGRPAIWNWRPDGGGKGK